MDSERSSEKELDNNNAQIIELGSIHEIKNEWFSSPEFSVLLPKLPEPIIKEIGYDNKKILLKKNIFTKNHTNHSDIPIELNKEILDKSIYHGTFFVKDKPNTKPNYWVSFYLNINGYFYRTLLDFDPNKKYVKIVGWLSENQKSFIEVINRCDREGGQILIRN